MQFPLNPATIAQRLNEYWSPRVIGEVDDLYVKVAKVQGEFVWHSHADEDELFFVLQGTLAIELRDRTVEIGPGELFIVPKGVEHCPRASEDCLVLLLEKKSTRHTGTTSSEWTRELADQLRKVE